MNSIKENVICVIPARYGSERFPGKVLHKLNGKTLLEHVFKRAASIKVFSEIIVATDHKKIAEESNRIGAKVVMTSSSCKSGTDRVAEAVKGMKALIVVNIQADEPFLPKEAVEEPLKKMLADKKILVATSAVKIRKKEELYDQNTVKVVLNKNMDALYFSRSLIPFPRIYFSDDRLAYSKRVVFYKHIGVYLFRKNFLSKLAAMPESFLEHIEKLEQLRVIENGYQMKVVLINKDSPCIDTIEDLNKLQ